MSDLAELGFEPNGGDEVIGQGSAVLMVLFLVVLNLSNQVVLYNCFVVIGVWSGGKEDVVELGRSGDSGVDPLPVYTEKPPIENRNFVRP